MTIPESIDYAAVVPCRIDSPPAQYGGLSPRKGFAIPYTWMDAAEAVGAVASRMATFLKGDDDDTRVYGGDDDFVARRGTGVVAVDGACVSLRTVTIARDGGLVNHVVFSGSCSAPSERAVVEFAQHLREHFAN